MSLGAGDPSVSDTGSAPVCCNPHKPLHTMSSSSVHKRVCITFSSDFDSQGLDATTVLFIGTDSGDEYGGKMHDIASDIYNSNPLEIIGGDKVNDDHIGPVFSPVIRNTDDQGVTKLLDCSCVQEKVGTGQIRQMVSSALYLN